MSFECLLVSRDPAVVSQVNKILRELAVNAKICLHPSKALDGLAEGSADLVVLDFGDESCANVLRGIWKTGLQQRPTVVAISTEERPIPGAHICVKKPLTAESTSRAIKDAYSRMLRDYRRHARCALLIPVTATDDHGRSVPLTVTDIGYGGVGLRVKKNIGIGETLSFHLALPNAERPIRIDARVLWTRSFGTTGCEFARIPPVDLDILHDWLVGKIHVKKPLVQV